MEENPNGAGFRPEVEDVPTNFEVNENNICENCGEEVTNPMSRLCDDYLDVAI